MTGVYDNQDRMLEYGNGTTSHTFSYTDNGELLVKYDPFEATATTTTFDYDVFGNLLQVDIFNGSTTDTITYEVDSLNRRVMRGDGTTTQRFMYGDQLNPIAELDEDGDLVTLFVYGSRPHVPDLMFKGNACYRFVTDARGSVIFVVDIATGLSTQTITYDEWGNPTFEYGDVDFQPFGFCGGLYDPDTKLERFGARDYDPEVGRWTTKEPIGFIGSSNFYVYCSNDPINFIDFSGFAESSTVVIVGRYDNFGDASSWHAWNDKYDLGYQIRKVGKKKPYQDIIDTLSKGNEQVCDLYVSGHNHKGGVALYYNKGFISFNYSSLSRQKNSALVYAIKNNLDPDATIWLLSCGAGKNKKHMQNLANLFNRKVAAYTGPIKYIDTPIPSAAVPPGTWNMAYPQGHYLYPQGNVVPISTLP